MNRENASLDRLTPEGVRANLAPGCRVRPEVLGEVTSTNSLLRERAAAGESEGCAILAESQTGGRGRRGRSFFSPPDAGLYMSLLLRPKLSADHAVRITTAAAVAVCEAIESELGLSPAIKWVNDIFVGGKKVCGILTEGQLAANGSLEWAVLGVGINLYAPEGGFPQDISATAGALLEKRQPGLRDRLAGAFLSRFMERYQELESGDTAEHYRERCFVIGRRVEVSGPDGPREALALGIDGECRLLVRYEDGSEQALSSGEISVKLCGEPARQ